MTQDVRWEQRFSNFIKALKKLEDAVAYIKHNYGDEDADPEDIGLLIEEMMKESLIQRFEYTHELAWNVMKDYAIYQGNAQVAGSRDATREAFQLNLISDGHLWMDMIASRNKTSHTYNEETANEIFTKIINDYANAFAMFRKVMEDKRSGQQQDFF